MYWPDRCLWRVRNAIECCQRISSTTRNITRRLYFAILSVYCHCTSLKLLKSCFHSWWVRLSLMLFHRLMLHYQRKAAGSNLKCSLSVDPIFLLVTVAKHLKQTFLFCWSMCSEGVRSRSFAFLFVIQYFSSSWSYISIQESPLEYKLYFLIRQLS